MINPMFANLKHDLTTTFTRDHLLPAFFASLVNGILLIVVASSFASLLFSGELTSSLPLGIGLVLFSTMITTLVLALFSSFRGVLSSAQDGPLAALVLAAVHIVENTHNLSSEGAFITVVAMVTLASLLTGVVLLLLGHFRLGNLIRFIPYPVIGGFLAGTGLMLFAGGLGVMTSSTFDLMTPWTVFTGEWLPLWLPGFVFAVLLVWLNRRYDSYLITPVVLAAVTSIFWVIALASGGSVAALQADGWLLGPFPPTDGWRPVIFYDFSSVFLPELYEQLPHLGTALLISVVAMLLNASGLEVATEQDGNLDHELQIAGWANIASAVGGGVIGFHALSPTVLARKMGAASRWVGIFMALIFLLALMLGAALIELLPALLLGGLLVYLGLSLMIDWLYDSWFKMPHGEYAIIVLIVAAVGTVGYLEGILLGVLASAILFTVQYSRINVVRFNLSGANYRSKINRPDAERRVLKDKGDQIALMFLEGVIFFGAANRLLTQINQRIEDTALLPLRYLVLDFRLVKEVDMSVVYAFLKLRSLAAHRGFLLIFSNVPPQVGQLLTSSGFALTDTAAFRLFATNDEALEWCEDQVLSDEAITPTNQPQNLEQQLDAMYPSLLPYAELITYLERREFAAGEYLAHQGEMTDTIFFVESGDLAVELKLQSGGATRIRKVKPGAVIGEAALYAQQPRSASLVAQTTCVVYIMTREAVRRMERDSPVLAAVFHRFIASVLSERLMHNTYNYSMLMR